MIDCSRTENYFKEKARMTKKRKYGVCKLKCTNCPLSVKNNGTGVSCSHFETGYPGKAIAIMQKWSDEHPQKTYLSELLEHFPNVPLTTTEIPEDICPFHLGFMSKDDCRNDRNCIKCWNQPIKNNEEGEEND